MPRPRFPKVGESVEAWARACIASELDSQWRPEDYKAEEIARARALDEELARGPITRCKSYVGMIESRTTYITRSGREIMSPKIGWRVISSANAATTRVSKWLLEEAAHEPMSEYERIAYRSFSSVSRLQPHDRDDLSEILGLRRARKN